MKRKNEKTNLTMNDWTEACLEIEKLAPDHHKILTSIKPYMPAPDTSLIYFTKEDAELLTTIVRELPPDAVKHASAFMQLYVKAPYIRAQKLGLMAENQYLKLPAKTTRRHLIPQLDRPTLSALMSTCRFFSTSQSLRTQRAALPEYRICAGEKIMPVQGDPSLRSG